MGKINTKSIEAQLIFSFVIMGVSIVLLISFTLIQISKSVNFSLNSMDVKGPLQQASYALSNGMNRSNIALINYLQTEDDAFKTDRVEIWNLEIVPAIDTINHFIPALEKEEDKIRFQDIIVQLNELKKQQLDLENHFISNGQTEISNIDIQNLPGYVTDSVVTDSTLINWIELGIAARSDDGPNWEAISDVLIPISNGIDSELKAMVALNNDYIAKEKTEVLQFIDQFKLLEVFLVVIALFLGVVLYYLLIRKIHRSIHLVKERVAILSKGDLPESQETTRDELGTILEELGILSENLRNVKDFALEVGKGHFDSEINVFDNKGEIGQSLAEMRSSLKKVAEENMERNWSNKGFAQFGDILRQNSDDIEILTENIIINLVKYLKVNQGAIFVLDNSNEKDLHLELTACYAYERKKHLNKTVKLGEGLVGQCFLEKKSIYLKEIPAGYMSIKSGLGNSEPNHLFLAPLKIDNEVFGVIEIASFKKITQIEKEFVEQLTEGIASAISSVKTTQNTKALLSESQQATEEMQSQEEEMRQNLEELEATQENMKRAQEELSKNEALLNSFINSTEDSLIGFDEELNITLINRTAENSFDNAKKLKESKEKIFTFFKDTSFWKEKCTSALKNISDHFVIEDDDPKVGKIYTEYYVIPIKDERGKVLGGGIVFRDVTQQKIRENELQLAKKTIDNAPISIEWITRDGSFYYVNKKTCEYSGRKKETLESSKVFDIDPDLTPEIWEEIFTTFDKDKEKISESMHTHLDGHQFPIEISGKMIDFGDESYYCAYIKDISKQKEHIAKLEKKIEELKSARK